MRAVGNWGWFRIYWRGGFNPSTLGVKVLVNPRAYFPGEIWNIAFQEIYFHALTYTFYVTEFALRIIQFEFIINTYKSVSK